MEYITSTVAKYNLDRDIMFESKVVESIWDENSKKWKIKVDQKGTMIEDEADVLINGSGYLKQIFFASVDGI